MRSSIPDARITSSRRGRIAPILLHLHHRTHGSDRAVNELLHVLREQESPFLVAGGAGGAPETGIEQEEAPETDYRSNTLRKQQELQDLNRMNLNRLYEEERDGVQVQEAY